MNKLILKHQLKDGKGTGKLSLIPETEWGKWYRLRKTYDAGDLFKGKKEIVVRPKRTGLYRWATALTKLLLPSELMYPFSLVGQAIDKVPGGTWFNLNIAPVLVLGNYAAALHEGSLNPYRGAELRANDERLLGAYLPFDFFGPSALAKGVKGTFNEAVNTAAKHGNKTALAYEVSRAINEGVKDYDGTTFTASTPNVRTKLGDVEVDNPQLAYRQVGAGGGKNFLETGYAFTPLETLNMLNFRNGTFLPTMRQKMGLDPGWTTMRPMYSQGKLWFEPGEGDLITTALSLRYGNSKGGITNSATKAGTRRISDYRGEITPENASVYTWEPNYGYRQITTQPTTYNHPGAFLNLEEAIGPVRRSYMSPDLQRQSWFTRDPLMADNRPTLTAGLFEHYFNQGKFKKYEDLLKYKISDANAKKLFELANSVKKNLGYFTSRNLKDKDFNLFDALIKNTENNLFGKKGANDAIKAAKRTSAQVVRDLLNKYIPKLEEINDRTRLLTGELYGKQSGKDNFIDWLHDESPGVDFLGNGVYDPRYGKVVNETPFLQRYYENVMEITKPGGLLEKLIRDGKLRLNEDGQWIGLNELGEYELVDAKLYVISQLENFKASGNRYTSMRQKPVHGTKLNSGSISKLFADPSKKYLFAVDAEHLLNGEILNAENIMLNVYSGKTGSQIPFYYKAERYEGDPLKAYPKKGESSESNNFGKYGELKTYFDGTDKAHRVEQVVDPTNHGGAINEYDFGKGTPNIKSMWNTLDFEPRKIIRDKTGKIIKVIETSPFAYTPTKISSSYA